MFVQGLKELGWIEGRNVQLDIRLGAGVATTLKFAHPMKSLPFFSSTAIVRARR
jgi:hypothetical protein